MDPWGQTDDIYGDALYIVLDLDPSATGDDIKKAYRQLAKKQHPDKGGDPKVFARLQYAYEVLSDQRRRQVYDTWAKELQFKYARPTGSQALGGEDILLNEFDALGLHCDPGSQLVVTCEVCRRPATKQCWTCNMQICEFCTLKRHWKDGIPLHWPLINSDHMSEKLAKRELEKKRLDDAKRLALENPHHRSETEMKEVRNFRHAAQEISEHPERQTIYDLRVARYYMWAQTSSTVYIACMIPTGYADRDLVIECTGSTLLIQPEDSPPIIDRFLAHTIDTSVPLDTMKTNDNRVCVVILKKSEPHTQWRALFRGDSDGVRCVQPPYVLTETEDDVIVELTLPFWIDAEDILVDITDRGLTVEVRNTVHLRRTYWRNGEEEERRRDYCVVDTDECAWCLDDDVDQHGESCRTLVITLARPELTEEEVMWKKGQRQDNRNAKRHSGGNGAVGFRFFADDEDWFELEDVLQALCFAESGACFVSAKPWDKNGVQSSGWVKDASFLSSKAQSLLASHTKSLAAVDNVEC